MNRILLGLGATLWMTAMGVAIGAGSVLDERLEVAGNVKLHGAGNGLIFPDGAKLTRASSTGGNFRNTVLGVDAAISGTVFATDNTAIGFEALRDSSLGDGNTAIGRGALQANTEGSRNTAVGDRSLPANTTGIYNIAVGHRALEESTTGHFNTAIGVQAAGQVTNGTQNTAVGALALVGVHTGDGNIALGYRAGYDTVGLNNILIGNYGDTESNTIRIGRASGTEEHFRTFIAGIRGVTPGSSNTAAVLIDSHGQLGTNSSSRRYKEDIHDMGAASAALMHLRPVTFRYRRPYADGSKPLDYGLIAEEVAAVYPDLVVYGADGQVETVQYHKLTPLLLNEVQQQYRRLAELEAQNAALLKRLAALEGNVGSRCQK